MGSPVFLSDPAGVGRSLAAGLLQIRAVEIRPRDPFTWSSGWKSPIYCDNRLILGYPVLRNLVVAGFRSIVEEKLPGIDLVAGAATGGIAHAALLADRLGLPTAYVRSGAKGHGRQKQCEGRLLPGMRAVMIEDTLSTGRSAYDAVAALQAEGVQVLAVCTIFSYDFDIARARAEATGIPAYRLVDYGTLLDVAVDSGYVSEAEVSVLMRWRAAPDRYEPPAG